MVSDLLDHRKVSDSGLDGGGDTQGDVTEHLLIILIPGVKFISRVRGTEDKPLALGPKVDLHGGVPLLPVGASEGTLSTAILKTRL